MKLNTNIKLKKLFDMPEDKLARYLDTYYSALRKTSSAKRWLLRKIKVPIPPSMRNKIAQNVEESIADEQWYINFLHEEFQRRELDSVRLDEAYYHYEWYSKRQQQLNETSQKLLELYSREIESIKLRMSEWEQHGRKINRQRVQSTQQDIKIYKQYLLQIRRGYVRLFDVMLRDIDNENKTSKRL